MLNRCVSIAVSVLFTAVAVAVPPIAESSGQSTRASARKTSNVEPEPAHGFTLEKLGDGVYAAIRREPPGFAVDANVLFVVNDQDVLVVDANDTPSSAREVIGAIRSVTKKPVRFVVNTHWHDDHIMGNQAYRDAFPGVEFIAHARMREYLPTAGVEARRQMLTGATQFAGMLRQLLASHKSMTGEELSDEERASHRSDVWLAERYISESPSVSIIAPTITIQDRLTLYRGSRTIEILHLGRGHTSGDIVVHLPAEHIVAAGDLVVWPVPLVGGNQSHVGEWSDTLGKLLALGASAIVPGHGPVLRDDSYVQKMAGLFLAVKHRAAEAMARGESVEAAHKSIDLGDFRRQFAGESRLLGIVFRNYVEGPAVESAYADASGKS